MHPQILYIFKSILQRTTQYYKVRRIFVYNKFSGNKVRYILIMELDTMATWDYSPYFDIIEHLQRRIRNYMPYQLNVMYYTLNEESVYLRRIIITEKLYLVYERPPQP